MLREPASRAATQEHDAVVGRKVALTADEVRGDVGLARRLGEWLSSSLAEASEKQS